MSPYRHLCFQVWNENTFATSMYAIIQCYESNIQSSTRSFMGRRRRGRSCDIAEGVVYHLSASGETICNKVTRERIINCKLTLIALRSRWIMKIILKESSYTRSRCKKLQPQALDVEGMCLFIPITHSISVVYKLGVPLPLCIQNKMNDCTGGL